ncbi:MAG: HAD family phosphatase [Acidimicrobiales bacterium]
MGLDAVVFDFDGVIRHWDPSVTDAIEDRHGLDHGAIVATGFGTELGPLVVTGALTFEEWTKRLSEMLHAPAAVAEWTEGRGQLDDEALDLVDDVRASGVTVALLSNATTRLEEDLAVLGIDGRFDHVFNTARMGVCKPDPRVYRQVLGLLGVSGDRVAFTDDTPGWAEAAGTVGMHGIHFTGVGPLRRELQHLGVGL